MKQASWLIGCVLACASAAWGQSKPEIRQLWFYMPTNLLVAQNVDNDIALLHRAAKAGYNGVLLTDSKFMRWDSLPPKYYENVRRVRQACRDNKLECVVAVCPMGYSEGILGRDPNLAEGLPVVDAPFVVKDGRLIPADDSARLENGGFEQFKGDKPLGWGFADQPGKISFADTAVKCEGRSSLRMQDIDKNDPQHGHGRVYQKLAVKPFRYYHVSLMVKTKDFASAREVSVKVLAGGRSLQHYEPQVSPTQDWKRIDVTFNSLDNTEVNLYLGVWGGKGGKIWWDDVRLEPAGLVNLLRRDGAPLKVTSEDGKTVYEEGRDYAPISDPKMGTVPWAGGYTVWHEQPTASIPPGSGLKEGQRVLLSYYHTAIIHGDQLTCCMSEPKVYDIIRWQVEQVQKHVQPDGFFMSHDEIRLQGWDESCSRRKLTPGQILADNVKKCTDIIRQEAPGKTIYVWSDMFDPHHNAAKTGSYYLVKGEGPWYGSWEGLDKDVVVCNWHGHAQGRVDSLRHFADRGHRQILAGYYDGPVERITPWLADAAKASGVTGVMYTTWRRDYSNLEKFAEQVKKPASN